MSKRNEFQAYQCHLLRMPQCRIIFVFYVSPSNIFSISNCNYSVGCWRHVKCLASWNWSFISLHWNKKCVATFHFYSTVIKQDNHKLSTIIVHFQIFCKWTSNKIENEYSILYLSISKRQTTSIDWNWLVARFAVMIQLKTTWWLTELEEHTPWTWFGVLHQERWDQACYMSSLSVCIIGKEPDYSCLLTF